MAGIVRRFGWLPDVPDVRDFKYKKIKPRIVKLPETTDLREFCSPVEDQGNLGSCTAQAIVANVELLQVKNGAPFADLSRLFLYYNERKMEGTVLWDNGAYIRDGIKSSIKDGICTEKHWPYVVRKFRHRPTKPCYKDALTRQAISYFRLETLHDMRTCLADGFPFVFGFSVYENFMTKDVEKSGIAKMPEGALLGGHAILAVGYDDNAEMLLFRNSWGRKWGMEGYGLLPYGFLTDRDLSDDFWTIRSAEQA